ncbi:MAG: hypothetical protein V2J42_00290 [Wenzhouxiangella sp.]|jgi:hypothetical protein|nr:hypothetical protein [Wenzhouxiangella sp.]
MVGYVLLRDIQDEGGSRQLGVRLENDGSLLIEGRDLGPGVEKFFGQGIFEYEWALKLKPPGVMKLKLALACQDNLLDALKDRFSGEASAELQNFLDSNAIQYEFWSRAGE